MIRPFECMPKVVFSKFTDAKTTINDSQCARDDVSYAVISYSNITLFIQSGWK